MLQHLRPAIVILVLMTLLTGLAYPFAITGIAAVAMPHQANGSLIIVKGVPVGSSLIGQNFTSDKYFKPRPSATSAPDPADATKTVDAPYNAANSGGSNFGPTSQKLLDRVKSDAEALKKSGAGPIPADAVTTSASGLDPDISPAYAEWQIPTVAKARGLSEDRLRAIVAAKTEGRLLGILGQPRVNVLLLNLALDELTTS